MELKRFLKRFKSDIWALGSSLFILLIALIALFAYELAPDNTQFANQMHLSIHSKPPGFSCQMLLIPRSSENEEASFLTGRLNTNEEIPISEIRWSASSLEFKRYGNATDYFETISFNQFEGLSTQQEIASQYLYTKRFLLGTDKYGRDLLSRLLVGSRISISIGFVAVFISLTIGVFLGAVAGYLGGWVDRLILWLINVVWSVPTLLMVLSLIHI